jgi:hypothetical protein
VRTIEKRVVIRASFGVLSGIGVIGESRLKGDLTMDLGVGSYRKIDGCQNGWLSLALL